MITTHKISQRQACKAVSLPQSSSRYKRKLKEDEAFINELQLLIDKHPSIVIWQSFYPIRRKAPVNN
jgi:putative transposase